MDFSYGLAQALAVKDNRIFTLETKRTELYNEIDRLQHIIEERDDTIRALSDQMTRLNARFAELTGEKPDA